MLRQSGHVIWRLATLLNRLVVARSVEQWGMVERTPYLAAYDIHEPRRLAAALKVVRAYSVGGQKSVHEVLLTPAEHGALVKRMQALMDMDTDRFLLLRLDPRSPVRRLGRAAGPDEADKGKCFYIG